MRVNEQAKALASLQPEDLPRQSTTFALITGGKGGVGKTTIAANLGLGLARAGRRVLVVDLDLGLANLNVLFGITPRYTLQDFLAGDRKLIDCIARGPGEVDFLPAGSGEYDMGRPDHARRLRILQGLAEIGARYDLILGDSAAGIGPDVLAFAAAANPVFVVTTPEPAAMTDAYGVIKALDAWATDTDIEIPTPEVFVNQVQGVEQAESIALKLGHVCEKFLSRRPRLAGWLPTSGLVRSSASNARPFALANPNSLECRCLGSLQRRVPLVQARQLGA